MANITPENVDNGIQSITMAAANGGGDTVVAVGSRNGAWELAVLLIVRNTDAATKTVTVDGVGYVVPATTGLAAIKIIGQPGVTSKAVTYSGVTGVTVGALDLAPN